MALARMLSTPTRPSLHRPGTLPHSHPHPPSSNVHRAPPTHLKKTQTRSVRGEQRRGQSQRHHHQQLQRQHAHTQTHTRANANAHASTTRSCAATANKWMMTQRTQGTPRARLCSGSTSCQWTRHAASRAGPTRAREPLEVANLARAGLGRRALAALHGNARGRAWPYAP